MKLLLLLQSLHCEVVSNCLSKELVFYQPSLRFQIHFKSTHFDLRLLTCRRNIASTFDIAGCLVVNLPMFKLTAIGHSICRSFVRTQHRVGEIRQRSACRAWSTGLKLPTRCCRKSMQWCAVCNNCKRPAPYLHRLHQRSLCQWDQPTVTFPIGDHINILHDYKITGPIQILNFFSCRCHHLNDMLVEFCQNQIFLTLLKRLNVPCPSIFTNFCINYYAHVPCGEKIAKNPSAYLNHLKIHGYTSNMFYQQTC